MRTFIPVKQQVNDISEVLRSLSAQIESMQKTIDAQHATICQINRTSQCQLKEIHDLKRIKRMKSFVSVFLSMKNLPKTPATAALLRQRSL